MPWIPKALASAPNIWECLPECTARASTKALCLTFRTCLLCLVSRHASDHGLQESPRTSLGQTGCSQHGRCPQLTCKPTRLYRRTCGLAGTWRSWMICTSSRFLLAPERCQTQPRRWALRFRCNLGSALRHPPIVRNARRVLVAS